MTATLPLIARAASRGYPNVTKCEVRGCPVVLFTMAVTRLCRRHRRTACCGIPECGYGGRHA